MTEPEILFAISPAEDSIANGGHSPIGKISEPVFERRSEKAEKTRSFKSLGATLISDKIEVMLSYPVKYCDFILDEDFAAILVAKDLWPFVKKELAPGLNFFVDAEVALEGRDGNKQARRKDYIYGELKYINVIATACDFSHSRFSILDKGELNWLRDILDDSAETWPSPELLKNEDISFEAQNLKFGSWHDVVNLFENNVESSLKAMLPDPLSIIADHLPHVFHLDEEVFVSKNVVDALVNYGASGVILKPAIARYYISKL